MKFNNLIIIFLSFILTGCAVGVGSSALFGTGVSIAMDPRTIGTQIDDSLMQKNLRAKLILMDKGYLLNVKTKVLDGRIFITGKVDTIEEKLKITKLGWEIKGARSVKKKIIKLLKKMSIKDITSKISKENNISKKVVYDYCLKKKNEI